MQYLRYRENILIVLSCKHFKNIWFTLRIKIMLTEGAGICVSPTHPHIFSKLYFS